MLPLSLAPHIRTSKFSFISAFLPTPFIDKKVPTLFVLQVFFKYLVPFYLFIIFLGDIYHLANYCDFPLFCSWITVSYYCTRMEFWFAKRNVLGSYCMLNCYGRKLKLCPCYMLNGYGSPDYEIHRIKWLPPLDFLFEGDDNIFFWDFQFMSISPCFWFLFLWFDFNSWTHKLLFAFITKACCTWVIKH